MVVQAVEVVHLHLAEVLLEVLLHQVKATMVLLVLLAVQVVAVVLAEQVVLLAQILVEQVEQVLTLIHLGLLRQEQVYQDSMQVVAVVGVLLHKVPQVLVAVEPQAVQHQLLMQS